MDHRILNSWYMHILFWEPVFFFFCVGETALALAVLKLTVDQVTFAVQVLGLAKILSKGGEGDRCGNVSVCGRTLNPVIYKLRT